LAQPYGSPGESREEQRRLRRLFVTTRSLLQVAEEAEDERELVMTVVQAAAIWHDVDARAYRRDLHGRFVLDVRLPGADLSVGPHDFSAFSVLSGPMTRISSIGEQEQLGWNDLSGELALLPIAASSQGQPRWVLAIPVETDAVVSSNLLLLCQLLGLCLDRMAARRHQELRKRLIRELVDRDDGVAELANAALAQVVSLLGAAQGRLVTGVSGGTEPSEGTEPRTMAMVGGEWTAGPTASLEPGQSLITPRRLTTAFSVGTRAVAILDLTAPDAEEFSISHAALLESAVGVMRTWLAGVLDGAAAQAVEHEPAQAFEQRIGEELAGMKRSHTQTGLMVIDLAPGAQRRDARVHTTVPGPVVRQLRSSDVLGRLKGGEICALLIDTSSEGIASAATRLHQNLEALAQQHDLPGATVGAATFDMADESVADVLARATQDAKRRSGEHE
jgi:GGDEF domain-containing protein